jgi:hypothetical protein
MKTERLREGTETDPVWEEISRLCRSQPPSGPDPVMQARVLSRLERPRRHAGLSRPALAMMGVVLLAATASAVWMGARRWLAPERPAPERPAPERLAPEPAMPDRTAPSAPSAVAPSPSSIVPSRGGSRVDSTKSHAARPKHASAPASATQPASVSAPKPAFDPQESVLVHSAMRALRVDRQTDKARALLDEYLNRFPQGALAEDALALQIEATLAARDRAAARRWATRYLQEFPSGRFRAIADKTLHEFSLKEADSPHP